MLHIYIPTYRRVDRQKTLGNIPKDWLPHTTLVIDRQDYDDGLRKTARNKGCNTWIVPKSIKTIAQKRAWIIENTPHDKIIMLDDDLRICRRDYRRTPTLVITSETHQVSRMFRLIDNKLNKFVHIGIGARAGDNNVEKTQRKQGAETKKELRWFANFRCMYALAYRTKPVRKRCKLGRIEHREDMDYTLQLLRQGYPNRVLVEFTVDQLYNTKGGASVDRKLEDSNRDAVKLAKLHPGFVKVVEKDYKVSVKRKEVICQWKKAYEEGRKSR